MAMVTTVLLIFSIVPTCLATTDPSKTVSDLTDLDLPSALADDDSFDDLPFEQLRQALREEVERDPKRGLSPRSSKQYNFLIR